MKLFHCPNCNALLQFESTSCACGASIGIDDHRLDFALTSTRCGNAEMIGCNWVPANGADLCRSCAMTTVKPDTSTASNRQHWSETERAKRWVLFCLAQWGWFGPHDPGPTPAFHMLSELSATGPANVVMGHASGVITLNVSEADAATRAFRGQMLGERFRTVIGHLRHELAHFLHMRLSAEAPDFAPAFRALFGDERQDYSAALDRHYAAGPPSDWPDAHITPYAAAHPHEDWAESAAHIQHIADIVDSFFAAGLSSPGPGGAGINAYAEPSADRLITVGAELGLALNHVNRSMGLPDIYPFVHTSAIREKLVFAHRWLRRPAFPLLAT